MGRGRPIIGTPEEAAERKRLKTAERVRRLRERRRASTPASQPVVEPASTAARSDYGIGGDVLRYLVERIERLEKELAGLRTRNSALAPAYAAERRVVQAALKDLWGEAETRGFSVDALREVVRLRKMLTEDRRDFEERVSVYKRVLGM